MDFLDISYIVITDIDSVEPTGRHKACKTDFEDALTSNASLKSFFDVNTILELKTLSLAQKEQSDGLRFVTFQKPVDVELAGDIYTFHGRTLEEAFVYENIGVIRSDDLNVKISLPVDDGEIFEHVYKTVKSSSFKKTEFALDIGAGDG